MNKKQKISIISGAIIILLVFIIWLSYGHEVFTKTQILVQKKDELFGTTYNVWEHKFIWGLDLTLVITAADIIITGVLYYIFRSKRKVIK